VKSLPESASAEAGEKVKGKSEKGKVKFLPKGYISQHKVK
jgi:hypothetical protein